MGNICPQLHFFIFSQKKQELPREELKDEVKEVNQDEVNQDEVNQEVREQRIEINQEEINQEEINQEKEVKEVMEEFIRKITIIEDDRKSQTDDTYVYVDENTD